MVLSKHCVEKYKQTKKETKKNPVQPILHTQKKKKIQKNPPTITAIGSLFTYCCTQGIYI